MTIHDFQKAKDQRKLTMVTCYDFPSACTASKAEIDAVLVGDSVVMAVHGHESTLTASIPLMELHTKAVARGLKGPLLVSDLPFLSYRTDRKDSVRNAGRLMKAGAHAVKLEGAKGNLELIQHLVESGIPVMGHLGLTPQSVHQLGGYKVQGRLQKEFDQILKDANELEAAGCFSLVLECVPRSLGAQVTKSIKIPTIGIGAGPDVDGQILVWHDLLGLQSTLSPKFLRRYGHLEKTALEALKSYKSDIETGAFPSAKESYEP